VREELGGYTLGALEPAEREAVEEHLAQCRDCAAEQRRLAGLPALLAHAEGLEIPEPPAAVQERVLDRIAQERGAARRRRSPFARLPGWARGRTLLAGGLAGAALGAGVTALVLTDDGEEQARTYSVALRGDAGASARAELAPGSGGTEVHLWVEGLPPGGDTVYEVICERPGWSASAGTFRVDSRGRAYAVLTTAARMGEYERIRVVRRPDEAPVLSGQLN
jgi:anti-sigma factor RsiW